MTRCLLGSFSPNVGLCDVSSNTINYLCSLNIGGNCSWICQCPQSPSELFYCCNEFCGNDDNPLGFITSFRITNPESLTPDLKIICKVSCFGNSPTHFCFSPNGNFLVVGNYSSGNFSVIRNDPFSGEMEFCLVKSHSSKSHVHQCLFSSESILTVVDLGDDCIYQYSFETFPSLSVNLVNTISFPIGYGPRHLLLHPSLSCAYILHELACKLSILNWDRRNGLLSALEDATNRFECSTIRLDSFISENLPSNLAAGELIFSPDYKYIVVSNRNITRVEPSAVSSELNSFLSFVSVFELSPNGLELNWVQSLSSRGQHPRYMTFLGSSSLKGSTTTLNQSHLVDSMHLLVVLNQYSSNISLFHYSPCNDEKKAVLSPIGDPFALDQQLPEINFLYPLQ